MGGPLRLEAPDLLRHAAASLRSHCLRDEGIDLRHELLRRVVRALRVAELDDDALGGVSVDELVADAALDRGAQYLDILLPAKTSHLIWSDVLSIGRVRRPSGLLRAGASLLRCRWCW